MIMDLNIFGLDENFIRETSSYFTLNEIYQQPKTWKKTCLQIKNEKDQIQHFIDQVITLDDFDVIMTGAGASGFIGNSLFSALNEKLNHKIKSFESTDIVLTPQNYLSKTKPTLLVSFARSGNSPESIGALELAETICGKVYHLIITNNKDGELSKTGSKKSNCLVLNLADETNDQAFAMTSSFTNMYLAAFLCFNLDSLDQILEKIDKIIESGQSYLDKNYVIAKQIVDEFDFNRIIYLGSNVLKGISTESALKMNELTSGKIATLYDSPLGFRHGPKSFVNDSALTVIYLSDEEYTRQYEIDLLKEMSSQKKGNKLAVVMNHEDPAISSLADYAITYNIDGLLNNILLGLDFILFAQTIAVLKSLKMGITPDNPCPSGEVNRVVKGVNIYPYALPQLVIGLVLTGHGNFATGMQSSLQLIAGKQENMAFVDFLSDDSTETLREKLSIALDSLSHCDSILILSDLAGGTPFNTSVMLQVKRGNMETIGGSNLPMILDVVISRSSVNSLKELKEKALQVGKKSIMQFTHPVPSHEEDEAGI